MNLVYMIIRVLQASYSRNNTNYQDIVNGTMDSVLKILDYPEQFGYYTFHPRVVVSSLLVIRAGSRPRIEEQFDIIRRLVKRLQFEIDHLESSFTLCSDEEDLSLEVEQKDRQSLIRQILIILTELLQRDSRFIHNLNHI